MQGQSNGEFLEQPTAQNTAAVGNGSNWRHLTPTDILSDINALLESLSTPNCRCTCTPILPRSMYFYMMRDSWLRTSRNLRDYRRKRNLRRPKQFTWKANDL